MTKALSPRQDVGVSESDRAPPARDTFDVVYEREFPYVWRTLGRLGVGAGDLPDAVHDVFIIVHRRWADLEADRPIRPWLFGIARKHAAGARRKRRELPRDDLDPAAPAAPQYAERDLLWRALAMLDADRRDVIVLHDLDGFTGRDIATALEIPVNTVHSRLRLGRADLVAALRRLQGATR